MQLDEQMMKEIILDHYQSPRNNELQTDKAYLNVRLKNPSCGDDLTIQVRFHSADKTYFLADLRQSGSGCSICCASASMMTELLKGKDADFAKMAINNFSKMIQGEAFDAAILEDAQALQGISKVIPRIKCANLAWQACMRALTAYEHNESDNIQVEIDE